ncbi:oxidoreductase [Mycobacterium simiae]|uniref:Oxidoreductase n=1 Tax=Mycobacterium simiae TaxID=1784 RepID=A0A1X0XY81_MYCSI|nr:GMC family oxidoreductase N-terminal domain-containing protein [Mycobacterium simiae]ORJ57824.1 oxidoreductase [Mycobacterium simiae]
MAASEDDTAAADEFDVLVRANQARLTAQLQSSYDFIVCGSGSSGSVVARRLAENLDVTVLLVEAGGSNDLLPAVTDPDLWPTNLGTERDWAFKSDPDPGLNGRSIMFSMGKVLGGGSSINVMVWARGHKEDWDFFASEARNPRWGYPSVLELYRNRIEDWNGPADPLHRGRGGPVFVAPAPDPSPLAAATIEGARSCGVGVFDSPNGAMMEGRSGGAAITDLRIRDGRRQSVFRSYTYPYMDRPNLTVLTDALLLNLTFVDNGPRPQVGGVRVRWRGRVHRISASSEVVLSLGAVNTPKVLMQSGIGDFNVLRDLGILVRQHLPGVGRNFQDHVGFACVWEAAADTPRRVRSEATMYWPGVSGLAAPDLFACSIWAPHATAENIARFGQSPHGWSLFGGLARPSSRGQVLLSGRNPLDPARISANLLSCDEDVKAAIRCTEFLREVGNSFATRPYRKREIMPGSLTPSEMQRYVRDAATTYWHQVGTAKMGYDAMAVVDGRLKVHGVDGLRIADGSILPRLVTSNTMAACVVIGEQAAAFVSEEHGLQAPPSTYKPVIGAPAAESEAVSRTG